jgi:hypothetical protein
MEEATITLDEGTCRTVVGVEDLMVALEAMVAAAALEVRAVAEAACPAVGALRRQLMLERQSPLISGQAGADKTQPQINRDTGWWNQSPWTA